MELITKEFGIDQGRLVLKNKDVADNYIQKYAKKLIGADKENISAVISQIFVNFDIVYEYDIKTAILPEPYGWFATENDKKLFIENKLLIEDFNIYISNVLYYYHLSKRDGNKFYFPHVGFRNLGNYDELYDKAIHDYCNAIIMQDRQTVNDTIRIHAITASFVLPTLIEHFLGNALQVKLLFLFMEELRKKQSVSNIKMTEEEKKYYGIYACGNKTITFDAPQGHVMRVMYDLFKREGVLNDSKEIRELLGLKGDAGRMMNSMLHSEYATSVIKPEYLKVMQILFDKQKINLRNNIMHGSNENYDYFSIGFVSTMFELLWAIANESMFK